jgi:hypothetical protein
MPRSLACPLAAFALALGVPLAAAQDLAYVPPKGTYDTPASFFRPLKAVGETYEYNLTTPVTNGYQRQVRLKVIGLENVNRLTTLKDSVKQGDDAERARVQAQQASNPGSTGGQLGALLGKLNPLMAKEVDRQKEVAKDDLVIKIVEAGSPDDTPTAAMAEVLIPPGQIGGSIFGVKVNNKVRVAVTSDDFSPRVLIVLHRPKSLFAGPADDRTPEFSVVASAEVEMEGANKVIVTYDSSVKPADGSRGTPAIVVTSADGKAVAGSYKVRYYPQQ